MIEQQAEVTMVKDNQVWLSVRRESGCHSCQLNKGCGTGSLSRLFGLREHMLILPNTQKLKSGDHVIVAIPDKSYLLASVLIYLFPLLLMFAFGALGESLFHMEGVTVLLSLAGLVSGLMVSARLSRHKYAAALQPKIIRQIW